jgi:hypothetical protein
VHPDETEISLESDSDVHSEEENEILHHTAGLPRNEQQDEEFEEKQHQHERRRQQKSQKQLPRSASEWGLPSQSCSLNSVHNFAGGPHGMKVSEASHINHTSSPLAVFMSFFAEVIRLLVVETNIITSTHTHLTKAHHLSLMYVNLK